MIIDSYLYNVDAEPRAWLISKVNRISPDGIARITLAQDTYDQHRDYIERNEDGFIIGMWADYYKSNVEPTFIPEEINSNIVSKITCSGKPQYKIGGSAKTFTVSYFDDNNEKIEHEVGEWQLSIDNEIVPSDLIELSTLEDGYKIKVKFYGDDSYIGKILTVTNVSNDVSSSIDIEIIAL